MHEFVIFLLAAPFASFGEYAGHERRGSGHVPLRSAILGLVGAALGIDRADATGQHALRKYCVALQPLQESIPIRDFHTIQTVRRAKKTVLPSSRKEALSSDESTVVSTITYRDYRCDVMFGVAMWGKGKWDLSYIVQKLRYPSFVLHLGRKACTLSCPMNPIVVKQLGPVEALDQISIPVWLNPDLINESRKSFPIYSDPIKNYSNPMVKELAPSEPLDRNVWSFGQREVWQFKSRYRTNEVDKP